MLEDMIMARRCLKKKYVLVKNEEAFIHLIEKYWLEKGFVLVNTCPIAKDMNFTGHQRDSVKCRPVMTKSLPRKKKR